MSNFQRKPARWALTRGLVASGWEFVFDRNIMFVPFWEGQGNPRDLYDGEPLTPVGTATWGRGIAGFGILTPAHDDAWQVSRDIFGGLGTFTIVVAVDKQGTAHNFDSPFGGWSSPDFHLLWRTENSVPSGIRVIANLSGGWADFTSATDLINDGLVILAIRFDGTTLNLFQNGIKDANSDTSSGTMPSVPASFFGDSGAGSSQNNWSGILYYGLACSYAWTDAQIAKLARDPFGPFRMVDDISVIITDAVTISDYRFRQRFFG